MIPHHILSRFIGCWPLAARRGRRLRLTTPLEPLAADAKLPIPANDLARTWLDPNLLPRWREAELFIPVYPFRRLNSTLLVPIQDRTDQ